MKDVAKVTPRLRKMRNLNVVYVGKNKVPFTDCLGRCIDHSGAQTWTYPDIDCHILEITNIYEKLNH